MGGTDRSRPIPFPLVVIDENVTLRELPPLSSSISEFIVVEACVDHLGFGLSRALPCDQDHGSPLDMAFRHLRQERVRLIVPRLNTLLGQPLTSCSHSLPDLGIACRTSLAER